MQILHSRLSRCLLTLTAGAALAFAPALPAQQAQALTPTSNNPNASGEAPLELPPFEVRTDQDTGYVAQNTTAGSRLNTSLMDLAAPISVFTAQFLEDIGATNVNELSMYASNTERQDGMVGDVANGNEFSSNDPAFRIRGLASGGRMVNYFERGTEVDTFNTERVEFSRGPNAVLFGLGQAGGAFNVGTKKADVRRHRYSGSVRVGDYDAFRTTIDLNRPIVRDRLALRLNLVKDDKESWRPNEFKDQERLAATLSWKVTKKTDLNVEYEIGHVENSQQRMWGSFDSYTLWASRGRQLDPTNLTGAALTAERTARGIMNRTGRVFESNTGRVINLVNQTSSAQTPQPGTTDSTPTANPMLTDFSTVPMRATLGGKGVGTAQDTRIFTATLQHEILKDWFVEGAYNRQNTAVLGRDIGNTELRVQWDTSPFLSTGAFAANTPNPNAGRPYVEALMFGRNRWEIAENIRLTSSYEFDLGKSKQWLGSHRFAGMLQRTERTTLNQQLLERITQGALNTNSVDNAANALRRRTYVDLGGPVDRITLADFRTNPVTGIAETRITNNVATVVPVSSALVPSGGSHNRRIIESMMITGQSRFLKERLVTTLGFRRDDVTTYSGGTVRTPTSAYGNFTLGELYAVPGTVGQERSGQTQTIGVVYRVLRNAAVFYNRSKSFDAAGNNRIAPDQLAPPPTGLGEDFGVKVALLDGKLFASVSYYKTSSKDDSAALNVQFSSGAFNSIWEALDTNPANPANPAGPTILQANNLNLDNLRTNFSNFTFDSESKGWEFELVANPAANWRVSFNFSDNQTTQTNTARELFDYIAPYHELGNPGSGKLWDRYASLPAGGAGGATIASLLATFDDDAINRFIRPEGTIRPGDARYSANARTNYTFTHEKLRGLGVGGGVRWRAAPVVGYTSANPATRRPINGIDSLLVDANLSYRFNTKFLGRRHDLTLQLNVNNLFDETEIVPTRLFDNGQIRTYKFQNPRDIFLTATVRL
jgi:iron complex outermembrane receptor protein